MNVQSKSSPNRRGSTQDHDGEHAMSSTTKQIIQEKDRIIHHLNDKMEILELKVQKLEQLLTLKDAKIESLQNRL